MTEKGAPSRAMTSSSFASWPWSRRLYKTSAMASRTIEEGRIKRLNTHEPKGGDYILYWMQQSQRAEFNPALIGATSPRRSRGMS